MIPGFGLPSSLGRGQVLVGRVVLSREGRSSSPVMRGRPRPSLQGGGGLVDLVSSREAGEEVPGSESPALSPLPASTPFRSAPDPRHLEVGGRLRCFLPFWKAELETSLSCCGPWRASILPQRPNRPFVPKSALFDSLSRLRLPSHRFRGGSSVRVGGHRGGGIASPASWVHQLRLLGAEEG